MNGFGIFCWYGYRYPLEERVRLVRDAGYAATSIWLGRQEPLVWEGKGDRIPGIVRDGGLTLEYVHASYAACNKMWSASAADREIIHQEYAAAVRYCGVHRIPFVVMHVVKGMNPPRYGAEGLTLFRELVRLAEEAGVRIAIENTRHPSYVDYLLSNIDSPSLGLCYDSSHDFLYSPRPGSLLARWGQRLFVTHLSDNDGLTDKHWIPGSGGGNWRAVAESFPSGSFEGFLTLEVLPKRDELRPAERFLRQGIERLHWLDAMIHSAAEPSLKNA